jgi:hypothetical protein
MSRIEPMGHVLELDSAVSDRVGARDVVGGLTADAGTSADLVTGG